jgi:DNA-directed RNA polymerase subunit alpha
MVTERANISETEGNSPDVFSVPLFALNLSVRASNVLKNENICFLGELAVLTEPELLRFQNCGRKTVKEIKELLNKYGLRLGMPRFGWSAPEDVLETVEQPDPSKSLQEYDEETRIKLYLRVKELNFSLRASKALSAANIEFVGDLIGQTETQFLRMQNCGRTTVDEIKRKLDRLGLSLDTRLSDWDRNAARIERAAQSAAGARKFAAARNNVVPIPQASYLEDELQGILETFVGNRNTEVVLKLFGWSGQGRRTLESVAQDFGITRERVRQIASKATRKMRDHKVDAPCLLRAAKTIRQFAPAISTDMAKTVQETGISRKPFDPSGLASACEELGLKFGLEVCLISNKHIYGQRQDIQHLLSLLRMCKRISSARGCTNFDAMCDDIEIPESKREKMRGLVSVDSRTKWLDDERCWLFATGLSRNRLSNLVAKVLNISPEIRLGDLRRAVAKSRRLEVVPPSAVLASFLETNHLAGVLRDVVTANSSFEDAIEPGGAEDTMVRVLQTHGPVLGWDKFQEYCIAEGMNPVTIGIYMSISPVIARLARGVYSLVGAKIEPGIVEEIADRLSKSRTTANYGWSSRGTLWCAIRLNRSILISGSTTIPTFVSDLVEGKEWGIFFGGKLTNAVLKCRNHFIWALTKPLASAGAEPDDICILEFDLSSHVVTLAIGSEDLVDAWENGDIDLLGTGTTEIEKTEE